MKAKRNGNFRKESSLISKRDESEMTFLFCPLSAHADLFKLILRLRKMQKETACIDVVGPNLKPDISGSGMMEV